MKNLASIVLAGAISLSGIGCSSIERSSLLEIASQRDGTSEDGWEYQIMNLAYKEDKEGFWQPPIITLEREYGDCEDFATLSAFYSGRVYGNKILIMRGESKDKDTKVHVIHLLSKDKKFGARCYSGESVYAKYSFSGLIKEIQRRSPSVKYSQCFVLDMDKMKKDWRTTREDLSPYFLRMLEREELDVIFIKDLK